MRSMNNSNWTYRESDIKVFKLTTHRELRKRQQQRRHSMRTEVINNSMADME